LSTPYTRKKKKSGALCIDYLWALLLMEANLNFGNKLIFGHQMIQDAEHNNEIPMECFGSVKAVKLPRSP
jgi:hypothetical protein